MTRQQDGATIVELSGDVDVGAAQKLREVLADALAEGPVVVDLSDVRFIDSAGIGLLVTGHRRAAEQGSSFTLAAPSEGAQRVLSLTRTDRLLVVHASVAEALAALRG
ncbi:MAG: STAS domain-containing protein [Gaiellaceae bacterium]